MQFVESVANEGEVVVCEASVSAVLSKCRCSGYLLRRLPFHGVLPLVPTYSTPTKILWCFTYLSSFQDQRY